MTTPESYAFDISTSSFGPGEMIQGTNNAFDGSGRLLVGGTMFRPNTQTYTTADSGQTVATDVGTAAGLTVSRKTTVPNSGGEDFARTVDTFTNTTGSDITTTVEIVGNFGANAATTVLATATGDATPTPADQWFAVGGGTSPAVVYYLHGLYGLQPASVSVVGDNVAWTYNLTVPAGQTQELAYFTIQAANVAQATTEANAIVGPNGFLDTGALGLTANDLAALANFQFNQAPTDIALSSAAVPENQPPGTVVGSFSATDPNAGDTHIYTLVSGAESADNASFTIVGNTLETAATFNFDVQSSYSIRVCRHRSLRPLLRKTIHDQRDGIVRAVGRRGRRLGRGGNGGHDVDAWRRRQTVPLCNRRRHHHQHHHAGCLRRRDQY